MTRSRVLVGTSSWADRSLVHGSHWYPRRSMRAAERMVFYASRLDLVEIDATARFPPTPDLARQWVERTPPGFVFDVQGWSLLAGAAALPDSLWEDLRDEVRPELRDRRRLYLSHLSSSARREAWERFRHALTPLLEAGRLGAVVLRYPHWLKPGETGRKLVAEACSRLHGLPLAVQLRNPAWVAPSECEETLAFLEDHAVAFVCVDDGRGTPVVASTSDLAVVRFEGRNPGDWDDADGDIPIAQRYAYRYTEDELAGWMGPIEELAAATGSVHVIFANCWQDDAVTNAEHVRRHVTAAPGPPSARPAPPPPQFPARDGPVTTEP